MKNETIIEILSVENRTIKWSYKSKKYIFSDSFFTHLLTFILRICAEYNIYNLSGKNEEIQFKSSAKAFLCILTPNKQIMLQGMGMDIVFTEEELYDAKEQSLELLGEMYKIIDFRLLDPVYLEHMLWIDLPYLYDYSYELVKVDQLMVFSRDTFGGVRITESPYYKFLIGQCDSLIHTSSDFQNQTPEERLLYCVDAMKDHQYGNNGQYIILYNDSPIIRDGSHRAASLYYLYGNIEIKVMQLRFRKNYYSYNCFVSRFNRFS